METTFEWVWLWASISSWTGLPSTQCPIKTATPIKYSKLWANKWWRPCVPVQKCRFKAAAEGEGVLGTAFLGNSFETSYVFTRSHTAWNTLVLDNLDDDFTANDWMFEGNEPQTLAPILSRMDCCAIDNHRYLVYRRFPYYIVSEVDYAPWLTTMNWPDSLASHECMPPYRRPTIGHIWLLMSPLLFEIAWNVQISGLFAQAS